MGQEIHAVWGETMGFVISVFSDTSNVRVDLFLPLMDHF